MIPPVALAWPTMRAATFRYAFSYVYAGYPTGGGRGQVRRG